MQHVEFIVFDTFSNNIYFTHHISQAVLRYLGDLQYLSPSLQARGCLCGLTEETEGKTSGWKGRGDYVEGM